MHIKLCQPLLIHRVTTLLSNHKSDEPSDTGQALVGGTALLYLGLAISNVLFKRQLHRLLTKIRGSVIAAVHSKSLDLPSDKLSDDGALTLITADISRITMSLQTIDNVFATPFEVGVAIFLLQRQIGVSSVAPVVLSIAISIILFFNSNIAVPMQKAWLASVQERVAYTAAVLGFPQAMKMLGLCPYLTDHVQALRVKELDDYAQYRKYVTVRNCFSAVPQLFAPPATLIMYTLINGRSSLTPSVAFTTLSLVALLTGPIRELIFVVPNLQTALASLDRIEHFLVLGDRNAHMDELNRSTALPLGVRGEAIEMDAFAIATDPARNETVRIVNGHVQLGKEQKHVLKDINLAFSDGTISLVIGLVGSGKSTLLKAIMGEVVLSQGTLADGEVSDGFAYCAQDPWLPNDSIHNLITGQSELDRLWYSTVVHACALESDIATFPSGSETMTGTKGVSLSGGQRQRLALARALYSRKKTLIVDDVLIGLDANTSQVVFDRVLASDGLCKNFGVTVVFATHAIEYLPGADYTVSLGKDGSIVEQGTPDEMDFQKGYIQRMHLMDNDSNLAREEEIQQSTNVPHTSA